MQIDIVIPCYNAAGYITQTLESVFAQIYKDYKIIIIDDGSTDGSRGLLTQIAREHSDVQLIFNESNKGIAHVRNQAIQISEADYIAFLDADDLMTSDRLVKQVEYLKKHPECDVLAGNYQQLRGEKLGLITAYGELDSNQVYAGLLFENVIATSTVIFKRDFVVRNNIVFDEKLVTLEDYNFWVDCVIGNAVFYVMKDIVTYYRIVDTGLSRSNSLPEKAAERNKCFNAIHGKLLDHYGIKLSEKEKMLYMNFSQEYFDVASMSIIDRFVFFIALCKFRFAQGIGKYVSDWNKKALWRVLITW